MSLISLIQQGWQIAHMCQLRLRLLMKVGREVGGQEAKGVVLKESADALGIRLLLREEAERFVEELTRQLTEYGERLIARRKLSVKPRRPSRDFLKSFSLPKGAVSEQLIDEHLAEKYGV